MSKEESVRWGSLYDLVRCSTAHGIDLPAPLTPAHAAAIESARALERRRMYSDPKLLRLEVGPLLAEVLGFMLGPGRDVPDSGSHKRPPGVLFELVGAHDSQLVPLLVALSAFPGTHWPDYGTTMAFELWGKDGVPLDQLQPADEVVQVLVNGSVIMRTRLDTFAGIVEHLIPDNYEQECVQDVASVAIDAMASHAVTQAPKPTSP